MNDMRKLMEAVEPLFESDALAENIGVVGYGSNELEELHNILDELHTLSGMAKSLVERIAPEAVEDLIANGAFDFGAEDSPLEDFVLQMEARGNNDE